MQVPWRLVILACLALAACDAQRPLGGPQGQANETPEKPAAAAQETPCVKGPIVAKSLPEGVFRTADLPPDAWPRDYKLPLKITVKLPSVPEEIQRPSPPIPEERPSPQSVEERPSPQSEEPER